MSKKELEYYRGRKKPITIINKPCVAKPCVGKLDVDIYSNNE